MADITYKNYETPDQILNDDNLSVEIKNDLLKTWKVDEEALQRAASEGLNGGEYAQLQAVQKALSSLSKTESSTPLTSALKAAEFPAVKDNDSGIFGTKPV